MKPLHDIDKQVKNRIVDNNKWFMKIGQKMAIKFNIGDKNVVSD